MPLTPARGEGQGEDGLEQDPVSEANVGQEVWGTRVSVEQSSAAFRRFFTEFVDPQTNEPLYPRVLEEAVTSNVYNINLNCQNLHAFDANLYRELISYPQEIIPVFDLEIDNYKTRMHPEDMSMERIQVRTFNLLSTKNMRGLNPEDINTLVSIKGMVIRCGTVIPEMKNAFFRCSLCRFEAQVAIDQGIIEEPTVCPNQSCGAKMTMEMIHNRCLFADKQLIKVQETPDDIPEGETPHTVDVYAYENLVDVAKPGDRVEITGVYRADPMKVNPRTRNVRTVYKTFMDAIHFKKTDKHRLACEDSRVDKESEFFTSFEEGDTVEALVREREGKLQELGSDPGIYDRLVRSLAPSIWEMEDVKKGVLCQLFGGSNNEQGAAHGRARGELNVLMCGDPGTSKSQMLQFVHKIAPRGIYTSGKGSSAVGLTASISKDPETGEHMLESGALVLSDRGVCCIDEFDKMSDATRSILHEVMEQQTVSIAKAGIVCTLNARTSILASANPIESRYNPNKSVIENIQLGPTLLSRFDLIYLILDQPNEAKDRKLAKHLVAMYYETVESRHGGDFLSMETLTQYISYARKTVHPALTDDASEMLVDAYVEMRRIGQMGARKVVTATPRMLESLIRLSEGIARMRLSPIVELVDVEEARRLMSVSSLTAAVDPRTGRIDMDLLATGIGSGDRERMEQQAEALKELMADGPQKTYPLRQLHRAFNDSTQENAGLSLREFQDLLDKLKEEGVLQVQRKGKTDLVRLV